ncbi:MAG: TIGR00282 family metallophosphoesterase [Monoglobales bacterium]
MKILCIGDVVSRIGRDMLFKYVDELKYKKEIDIVIANAENSNHGRGMTRNVYEEMMRAGVDGFTMGNHTWGSREIISILKNEHNVVRPANYSRGCPGNGSMLLTAKNGQQVGVVNIIGRTYMDPADSPFYAALREIENLKQKTNIIIVDFHAEATSEKEAMGYFLDGKASAVFGTHTHVQTADEQILPEGTGYITDLGMTGASESILGMEKRVIIKRFLNSMPSKFELAAGRGQLCGCIFDINENGRCQGVERLFIRE